MRESRRAALLRRWSGGAALAPEEMAEVSDLVPPQHLVNPPLPSPGYRKAYDHYAKEYGYDLRNINRLIKLGRLARLPPPLDQPSLMPGWWEDMKAAGHFKQKCPQRVLDAAARALESAPPAGAPVTPAGSASVTPGATAGQGTKSGDPPSRKVDVDSLNAFGIAEAVRELSLQLAADQQSLREARTSGLSEVIVSRRQKIFNETLTSLRKTEESLQALQKARGDLAPVSQFREDLATILTTIRGMGRRRASNVCAKLAGRIPPETMEALRAALVEEQAREEAQLRRARHWRRDEQGNVVLPPDPAPAP